MHQKRFTTSRATGGFHLSIGDLMAAILLVVILLLIAAVTRLSGVASDLAESNVRIREIARSYETTREDLYIALMEEFSDDLDRWQATIDPDTLSFRFAERGMFLENDATLLMAFRAVLDDFVPRYLGVVYRNEFRDNVTELLVEGHTANPGGVHSFIGPMELAHRRSRNVLHYFYRVIDGTELRHEHEMIEWFEGRVGVAGYSHGRPIEVGGVTDWDRSRRVEFRILTSADAQIRRILGEAR